MRIMVQLILFASIIFFVLGLIFPIIATKQQMFGVVLTYKEVRLVDSIRMFYHENDFLLAGIILSFTILFPIVKFLELINRSMKWISISEKTGKILHALDKWSMLDVFLVALLLLNFKIDSSVVVMKLKMGTTFIALSVVLRMLYCQLINNEIIETYA